MHQESLRSASIWVRTRIFPNSKHGKIFFLAIGIGKLLNKAEEEMKEVLESYSSLEVEKYFRVRFLHKKVVRSKKPAVVPAADGDSDSGSSDRGQCERRRCR